MKLLACLLVVASCAHVPAPPPCDVRIPELVHAQTQLGHVVIGTAPLPPAAMLIVLQAIPSGQQYGLLVTYPGSLVPSPESPFNFAELCTAEGGLGRIYFAEFEGGPRL